MEYTWSGLGVTTPHHLETLPQLPDWSVAAVKGNSPGSTKPPPPQSYPLEATPTQSKKRTHTNHTSQNLIDDDASETQDMPEAKKQHPSPPHPSPPKRPPFPFAVPKPRTAPSHNKSSSTLNPFASEFVFRLPSNAPKLSTAAKEFSPVHLQQSSKSLFNVFAPEFNPSKPTLFGSGPFNLGKTSLFPPKEGVVFVKPSPTKKSIPIVKPLTGDSENIEDDHTDDWLEGNSNQEMEHQESDFAAEDEVENNSVNEDDVDDDADTEILEDDAKDENVEPTPSSDGSSNSSSTNEGSRAFRERIAACVLEASKSATVSEENTFLAPPTTSNQARRSSHELRKDGSNPLPPFWRLRLMKSDQKAKRDRALTPRGRIARALAKSDDDESETTEVNSGNLRLSPPVSGFLSDVSGSVGSRSKKSRQRNGLETTPVETLERFLKCRLEPALKRAEAIHGKIAAGLDVQNVTKREEGNEADDEDDEINPKQSTSLSLEKIKVAVIEALRQEKDLFASPATVVDTSATDKEIRDLKSVIDCLKSKLLDAEDALNREERRRMEYERKVDTVAKELVENERELDSKTEESKHLESQVKELQRNYDQARRDWDDEKHKCKKLEEVISGTRTSLGQMTDKNARLSQENSNLQSLSTSQKEEISSLREEISKARGENGKLGRERTRLERDVDEERQRFAKLQNEFMETGKAIAEQETRWREELGAEKLRVQGLERNLVDEERRVKKMEEECEKLAKIAEERVKLKAMVEVSVQRERQLERVKEELERRLYTAEAQVSLAKDECSRHGATLSTQFAKETEVYKAKISTLENSLKTLEAEKSKFSVAMEREKAKSVAHAEKITILEKDLEHAAQLAAEHQKSMDNLVKELDRLRTDISAYQQDTVALRGKIEKRDGQIEALRQTNSMAKEEIVTKDKLIAQLEFLVASATSPRKLPFSDDADIKLQKREKEILRLRSMLADVVRDNQELLAQSSDVVEPASQKKYVAMKNILSTEVDKRKAMQKELAKLMAKEAKKEETGRTPAQTKVNAFDTPASVIAGLDTPVSLKDTPSSLREFSPGVDTPLKGKGVFVE
jgi:hypothetical protein